MDEWVGRYVGRQPSSHNSGFRRSSSRVFASDSEVMHFKSTWPCRP